MTVAIDSGTTCMYLAAMLKTKAPLRIITSALAVIETLGGIPGFEINLVGGLQTPHNQRQVEYF